MSAYRANKPGATFSKLLRKILGKKTWEVSKMWPLVIIGRYRLVALWLTACPAVCCPTVPTRITSSSSDATLLSPQVARFSCHVTGDPSTCLHLTWSRNGGRPLAFDGRRVYLAADRSLIVNITGQPEVDRSSSLGAAYSCHVTNGMTSDRRQVRLAHDVIGGVSDWPAPLSWMSVNTVTGNSSY